MKDLNETLFILLALKGNQNYKNGRNSYFIETYYSERNNAAE